MVDRTNKPNVSIPLANVYDTRGVLGYTNSVTDNIDQLKVNSMYELASNPITESGRLKLVKRPGIGDQQPARGVGGQTAYLVVTDSAQNPSIIAREAGNLCVKWNAGSTTLIAGPTTYVPTYQSRSNTTGVQQMVVQMLDPTSGYTTPQRVFYGATGGGVWTEIVAANFIALRHRGKMEFIDGWALVMDNVNKIWNLDLNSLALLTNTNQFVTKQIEQDEPRGLARLGQEIIAFGSETMESFYNAGNATGSPLGRIQGSARRVGLRSSINSSEGVTHYYTTVNKSLYFIGIENLSDQRGGLYQYSGSECVKVSPPAIDNILTRSPIYSINRVSINGRTAVAIGLSDLSTVPGVWLMYFPEYKEWFEWSSAVFKPVNDGGFFLGYGQFLYSFQQPANSWTDYGSVDYEWTHQFRLAAADGNGRKSMKFLALSGDTARSATSIDVSVSDDDYQTFTTLGSIDMTSQKKTLYRMGAFYQRAVRFSYLGPNPVSLEQCMMRIE